MATIEHLTDVDSLLKKWDRDHKELSHDPVPILKGLISIVESEAANFLKLQPDPDDERHPSLSHPECNFGYVLNVIFEKEDFMRKLMSDYFCDTYEERYCKKKYQVFELNTVAFRLMLGILPGLETSVVFQPDIDGKISQLFFWMESPVELLQCCAANLLSFAMKKNESVKKFLKQNKKLVPLMFQKLRDLFDETPETLWLIKKLNPFSSFIRDRNTEGTLEEREEIDSPSHSMQQLFIIRYLTTIGKYPQFIKQFSQENSILFILKHINLAKTKVKDERLIFEALKCLSSLLCHNEFETQFLKQKGFQKLIDVRRPTRVDDEMVLQHVFGEDDMAYWQDTMEGICLMPKKMIKGMVSYAIFLLEKDFDFSRSHAMMFFGIAFSFKVIIDYFEAHDGLRKFFNVISKLNNEERCPTNKFICYSAAAIAKYVGATLYFQTEEFEESDDDDDDDNDNNDNPKTEKDPWQCQIVPRKASKMNWQEIQTRIESFGKLLTTGYIWPSVQKFSRLGGITFLLQTISSKQACNIKYVNHDLISSRGIENCLNVIAITSIVPHIMEQMSSDFDGPANTPRMALDVLFDAARGEISKEQFVSKAALRAVANCLCLPIIHLDENSTKNNKIYDNEELVKRILTNARLSRGIMTLVLLIEIKNSTDDADEIRTLACRALIGLARSQKVLQILSKLPLFSENRIKILMINPILPKMKKMHDEFRKYASEIFEKVHSASELKMEDENLDFETKKSDEIDTIVEISGDEGIMNKRKKLDRTEIYSRFCPVNSFKMLDPNLRGFTYCIYSSCRQYLIVGTRSGSIMMMNAKTGVGEAFNTNKNCFINYMDMNHSGNLLLTSSSGLTESENCGSVLWKIGYSSDKRTFHHVKKYDTDSHLELSKRQNLMIGTSDETASIYDIDTGIILKEFISMKPHCYRRNRATFSMNDDTVLHDGILWDVKSGKEIYRFDQLSDMSNGIFHPNQREVVLNGYVWDMRTYNLLKSVPNLDKMEVKFSPVNNIIYSYYTDPGRKFYKSSFETLDGSNYNSISIQNVDMNILCLTCNELDTEIATVEIEKKSLSKVYESCVKVYEVGKHDAVDY